MATVEKLKEWLADPKHRIKLADHLIELVKSTAANLKSAGFDARTDIKGPEVARRLEESHKAVADLQKALVLLAKWGDGEQVRLIGKAIAHVAEGEKIWEGYTAWIALSWYPCLVLMYSAGISALSEERYDALSVALSTPVMGRPESSEGPKPISQIAIDQFTNRGVNESFKLLPGHENNHVPRSEYLFKQLRPPLDDLLFLGRHYEALFDKFEVFLALTYADAHNRAGGRHWGPPGRFAYKFMAGDGNDPYRLVLKEAERMGANWKPIKAGMFQGSAQRFKELADAYSGMIREFRFY